MKKNILLSCLGIMLLCASQLYAYNVEQIQDILTKVIKSTDSFLVKAQTLPEVERKIKSWGKNNLLAGWEPSFEWNKVKQDIQLLRQMLQKLIEKDPKDNTYKYLNELLEQEPVVTSMEKLKSILVEHGPTLEASSFELEKMSEPVKKAITTILSAYTEVLYQKKMLDTLNKILEKYEPRAKELREEKEKAERLAQEEKSSQHSSSKGYDMVIAGAGGGVSESGSSSYKYDRDYSSLNKSSYDSSYDDLFSW